MDKLKATLEKTHQALEEEKHRTVDLLYSIFPGDVAQRLWQGLLVQAKKFDDVTMLFSDNRGLHGRVRAVHADAGHQHAERAVHALRLPVRHPGRL